MKKNLIYLFFIFFFKMGCISTNPCTVETKWQVVDINSWNQSYEDQLGTVRESALYVGKKKIPAKFELTSKGNGVLTIENLVLKVYDIHDDGEIFFPNGWLKVQIGGKEKDILLIEGIAQINDETGKVVTYKPIVKVFKYNLKNEIFETICD